MPADYGNTSCIRSGIGEQEGLAAAAGTGTALPKVGQEIEGDWIQIGSWECQCTGIAQLFVHIRSEDLPRGVCPGEVAVLEDARRLQECAGPSRDTESLRPITACAKLTEQSPPG